MTTSAGHESQLRPTGTITRRDDSSSIKRTARFAGLLYVLLSIMAVFGYIYVSATFLVPGDATATARKISEGAIMYRIGILTALASQILFLFLVLTLYRLFKDVDRRQARLMVVLVSVGVAAEVVHIGNRATPLVLLSGADFLSVFTQPQLDALALSSLELGNLVGQLITAFWGLWLFPFGILTIKSGFFPKLLGILLFVAGFAYVATSFAAIIFPAHLDAVSRVMFPLYLGELGMVFWLPIMGAKPPAREAPPSQSS